MKVYLRCLNPDTELQYSVGVGCDIGTHVQTHIRPCNSCTGTNSKSVSNERNVKSDNNLATRAGTKAVTRAVTIASARRAATRKATTKAATNAAKRAAKRASKRAATRKWNLHRQELQQEQWQDECRNNNTRIAQCTRVAYWWLRNAQDRLSTLPCSANTLA